MNILNEGIFFFNKAKNVGITLVTARLFNEVEGKKNSSKCLLN